MDWWSYWSLLLCSIFACIQPNATSPFLVTAHSNGIKTTTVNQRSNFPLHLTKRESISSPSIFLHPLIIHPLTDRMDWWTNSLLLLYPALAYFHPNAICRIFPKFLNFPPSPPYPPTNQPNQLMDLPNAYSLLRFLLDSTKRDFSFFLLTQF